MGAPGRRAALRTGRWALVAVAAASLLATTGLSATGAAMTATTGTSAGWTADGLAPPTSLTVSQACVAAPTPVRRGSTFTRGDATATLVLSTPSGVVAGDVLLAGVTWQDGGEIPAPSGWTRVRQELANPLTQAVFYRVAQAAEPTTHTWQHSAHYKVGGMFAYGGVDPASLLLATGSSGQFVKTAGGVITAPSLTVRRPGTVVVGFFGLGGTQAITGDSRMVTQYTGSSSGSGIGHVSVLAAEEVRPDIGDTGSRTSNAAGGSQTAGQLVALEPPLRPHATASWTRSTSTNATGQLYRRYAGTSLQKEVTLAADATSTVDGPLVSGTAYRAQVLATAGTTTSTAAETSFTARSCT